MYLRNPSTSAAFCGTFAIIWFGNLKLKTSHTYIAFLDLKQAESSLGFSLWLGIRKQLTPKFTELLRGVRT